MEFSASISSPYFPITGTDAFWNGSVPNPMVGSLNNPTSSLSSIRPEASAAGARHSLHSQDLGPVPVVPGGEVIPTLSIVTSSFQVGEFFRLPESRTWSVDGHQSSQYQTTHCQ